MTYHQIPLVLYNSLLHTTDEESEAFATDDIFFKVTRKRFRVRLATRDEVREALIDNPAIGPLESLDRLLTVIFDLPGARRSRLRCARMLSLQ